jgi:hypothetical protein
LGQGGSGKKKPDAGREMFIRETGSTGSSSIGALVAVNSLQPPISTFGLGRGEGRLLLDVFLGF